MLFLALALAAATAQAQIKCWNDAQGKRVCGDTPPPGARTTTIKAPPASSAPAPASKDAKKGPLTPAEQEQAYRKRQADAAKDAEKAAQAQKDAEAKKENCQRAQESLRQLESGQRIARTDAKGERYYMEDAQIAQEAAKARESVKQWCN
jgi:hypothetical protein